MKPIFIVLIFIVLYYKKYKDAIADYDQALNIAPDQAEIYYQRASAYLAVDNYQNAIDDYTKVIDLDSEHIFTFFLRGSIYLEIEEYQKRSMTIINLLLFILKKLMLTG